jgi:hypothetical protein
MFYNKSGQKMKNKNDFLSPDELLSYIQRYKLTAGKNKKGEVGYKLLDWEIPPTKAEIEEQIILWQKLQNGVDNHVENLTKMN